MTSKSKICIIVKETIAASAAAAAQEQSSVIRGTGQGTSGAGGASLSSTALGGSGRAAELLEQGHGRNLSVGNAFPSLKDVMK